jgi:AraC-like DNA-binding protein
VRIAQILKSVKKWQLKFQNMAQGDTATEPPIYGQDATDSDNAFQLTNLDTTWLDELRALIVENMANESLHANDLARLMYLSRTNFFAKVKALTGLSPAQLIRDIRLDTAKEIMLQNPKLPLRDVVAQVGLTDLRTFSNNFKNRFGELPKRN